MKTSKHPKNLTEAEAAAIVKAFDDAPDDGYVVVDGDALAELRAAAADRQNAVDRINSAAMRARSEGASWGVIGAQLGMTRQGARQRFERLTST
ncbi:MAG: hypothetical protein R2754_13885 [Microthrixaceae bacterium]